MKQIMRKILCLVLVACTILTMTSCGKKTKPKSDPFLQTPKTSPSATTAPAKDMFPDISTLSVSQCFSDTADGIWYVTYDGGFAKDDYFDRILVFRQGKLTTYSHDTLLDVRLPTMGELARMTDEEILDRLATITDESFNACIQRGEQRTYSEADLSIRESWVDQFPDWFEQYYRRQPERNAIYDQGMELLTELEALCRAKYQKLLDDANDVKAKASAELPYQVEIYTDDSGNQTKVEVLRSQRTVVSMVRMYDLGFFMHEAFIAVGDSLEWNNTNPMQRDEWIARWNQTEESAEIEVSEYPMEIKISYGMSFDDSCPGKQIYDSYYNGFRLDGGGMLLTRVDKGYTFVLDEVGTPGIVVDPS